MIKESNAVPVNSGVFADLADHPDLGFLVALGPTKDHLLFRTKLVLGEKAYTVQAEENGLRLFGENLARQIGADQDDGNLFGDASASAHNLLGHKQAAQGPISYPGLSSKLPVFSVEAPVWDTEQASPGESTCEQRFRFGNFRSNCFESKRRLRRKSSVGIGEFKRLSPPTASLLTQRDDGIN